VPKAVATTPAAHFGLGRSVDNLGAIAILAFALDFASRDILGFGRT
jgi:hypothetical protein